MSDWQYSTPYNTPAPGSNNTYGAGGGFLLSGARSIQDAERMGMGAKVPWAEYPDGYLNTLGGDRREGRQTDKQRIPNRVNQKSYQRGVHKGSAIDPADYYWTEECNPTIALEYQAAGLKWTQSPDLVGIGLVNGGKNPVNTPEAVQPPFTGINEARRAQLQRLRPAWR